MCGTPAWGFDRWERRRRWHQTGAQGNSHQTSHLARHTSTYPAVQEDRAWGEEHEYLQEKTGRKGEGSGWSIWKCVKNRRETVLQLPYCFLISELYKWLWIQAVSVQSTHHQYARPIEKSSLVLITAMTPSRWVLNMHKMNITHFQL